MDDLERVIGGLKYLHDRETWKEGPLVWDDKPQERRKITADALALLKAQEPVNPLYENYWKHTMGRCGHCRAPLPAIEGLRSKFCWMCGKQVKWDD